MKKLLFSIITATSLLAVGCAPITSDDAGSGNYSTTNPMSAIEYSIYMNKQITVYTSQLTTNMSLLANSGDDYENMLIVAESTLQIMEDTLDEVKVTFPANTYEDDRDTTITVMETTVEHVKAYINDLKEGNETDGYVNSFQNDYHALTGQANLYYQ